MLGLKVTYSQNTYYIECGSSFAKLEFYVQKIIDLRTQKEAYVEVLTRVLNQSGEELENEEFFDSVDDEFIKTLCILQLKYVRRKKLTIKPTINIALSLLCDEEFVRTLLEFSAMEYAIEVTPEDAGIDTQKAIEHIKQLKRSGIKVWLDDYDPENQLMNATFGEIAWDRIKIESRVVQSYSSQPDMLSSFLFVLAPFVTQGVVFDGIENQSLVNAIASLNVLAQGHFYGGPQSLKSFQCSTQGAVDVPVQGSQCRSFLYSDKHPQRVA